MKLGSTPQIERDGIAFKRLSYRNGTAVYLSEDLWSHFQRKFNHKKRTRQFPYHKNLTQFLKLNPSLAIFFTELTGHVPFVVRGSEYFVNIDSYIDFCKKIESRTEGRAQAFFGQHIDHSALITAEERQRILGSASLEDILGLIGNLSDEGKKNVFERLSLGDNQENLEDLDSFARRLRRSVTNREKRKVFIASYPSVQLETLKEHRQFLANNLDKQETFIQNWIDGKIDNQGDALTLGEAEVDRLKRSRCLIFGLEFINHKREGQISQKRFDVLTKIADGRNEYVLIELKSPCGNVFEIQSKTNDNGGQSTTYSLSPEVSRAIPQISHYKGLLHSATDDEWQAYGLPRGEVVKSIILVGTRVENDPVWNEHYMYLKHGLSSSIEIMTYTDLLDKLEATIKNLEDNL